MKTKPVCETVLPWLKANLGSRCLGGLTGTDAKALAAAVQIVELYSYCPKANVAQAFGLVVMQMQRTSWHLAYHAIAHVMDWDDRERLWNLTFLGPLDQPVSVCAYEPRARQTRLAPETFAS
jgi:hypothetical protein